MTDAKKTTIELTIKLLIISEAKTIWDHFALQNQVTTKDLCLSKGNELAFTILIDPFYNYCHLNHPQYLY